MSLAVSLFVSSFRTFWSLKIVIYATSQDEVLKTEINELKADIEMSHQNTLKK